MTVAKWIATCFGIGYIQKGAGTVAALFCCAVWYFFRLDELSVEAQVFQLLVLFSIGVWAGNTVEKVWGHDSSRVVIDEWLGMCVTLFIIPFTWVNLLAALVLFRFFDIAKPAFIRRAEALPGGWGVMADDLLAGVYSNVILHLLLKSHLL